MSASRSQGGLHHHASAETSTADPVHHTFVPVSTVKSAIAPGSSVLAAFPSTSSLGATHFSSNLLESAYDSLLVGSSYNAALSTQTSSFCPISAVNSPIVPGSSVSAAYPSTSSSAGAIVTSRLLDSAYCSVLAGTSYNAALSTETRPLIPSSVTNVNVFPVPSLPYNDFSASSQSFQLPPFLPTSHHVQSPLLNTSTHYRPILPAPVATQVSCSSPAPQNYLPSSVIQLPHLCLRKRGALADSDCSATRKSRRLESENHPNPKFTYDEKNNVQVFKFRAGECPPIPDDPERNSYQKFYIANDAISLEGVKVHDLGKFKEDCGPCKALFLNLKQTIPIFIRNAVGREKLTQSPKSSSKIFDELD